MKNLLLGVAWRITQNRMEAEDVVQDVMLKIWDMRNEWDNMKSIEAYCMTMTKNKALDKLKNKNFHARQTDLSGLAHYTDNSNPHQRTESHEQLSILQQVLTSLPEKQQQALQLREFEEKTYQEIAEILHITEEQVKVSLFRARQKIREEIKHINSYGI